MVVHGNWGSWVAGTCSRTCGNGQRARTRQCNNPVPANGGNQCQGSNTDQISCNEGLCPSKTFSLYVFFLTVNSKK